jgi:hypothetical protein
LSEATFVYCEKMDKKERRVLMKRCFLTKKITVEAKVLLDRHYLDSAPAKSTAEKWFANLKRGEMDARKRSIITKIIKKSTKLF